MGSPTLPYFFREKYSRFANFEIDQKIAKRTTGAAGAAEVMESEAQSDESVKKGKEMEQKRANLNFQKLKQKWFDKLEKQNLLKNILEIKLQQ